MTLVEMLKKHEGFRSKMYTDTTGHKTIGYGINLETERIPRPVAELWLAFKIDSVQDKLEQHHWYNTLDPVRQDVLIDMCFNLGHAGLLEFKKMIKALENKKYQQAAAEMLDSKWADQVGQRAVRLSELMAGLE